MSDDENRGTKSLIHAARGEIVVKSTSLVRRGLNLLEPQKPTEDQTFTQLREKFREQANAGEAGAQSFLGLMYEHGWGVPQDDAQAVKWWRKAAEQGHAAAQNNLGWAYQNGRGLQQDDAQAAEWYRKAAEQDNADAQCNLGVGARPWSGRAAGLHASRPVVPQSC